MMNLVMESRGDKCKVRGKNQKRKRQELGTKEKQEMLTRLLDKVRGEKLIGKVKEWKERLTQCNAC